MLTDVVMTVRSIGGTSSMPPLPRLTCPATRGWRRGAAPTWFIRSLASSSSCSPPKRSASATPKHRRRHTNHRLPYSVASAVNGRNDDSSSFPVRSSSSRYMSPLMTCSSRSFDTWQKAKERARRLVRRQMRSTCRPVMRKWAEDSLSVSTCRFGWWSRKRRSWARWSWASSSSKSSEVKSMLGGRGAMHSRTSRKLCGRALARPSSFSNALDGT
mmetsp:Transcript_4515/g.14635  ORF Transcript_4515/g.14635 Transcript_4515/m.14635 type:complete len:215 (-) Transcript_4515:336-980(-)